MYILLYLLFYLKTVIPGPHAFSCELKRALKPFAQGFPNYILVGPAGKQRQHFSLGMKYLYEEKEGISVP